MNKSISAWLALLLVPSLALANLSITYALVTPACAHQNISAMAETTVACLIVSIVITLLSWRSWRQLVSGRVDIDSDAGDILGRQRFVAATATLIGTLFTLVIAAQSIGQWMLSPCLQ